MIVASRGGSGLNIDQQLALQIAAARLQDEFHDVLDTKTIQDVLDASHGWFMADSAIIRFLRAERFARQRLRALAHVHGGSGVAGQPVVLFLDVRNASRSVMALGFFHRFTEDHTVEAWSGGADPSTEINPAALAAMRERGIDISREFPKPWTDDIFQAADVVVTMGCTTACPVMPGKRYLDWTLPHPNNPGINAIRPLRDEIEQRVQDLVNELGITTIAP
jgi:arsenate reductase (thioredoxin)